ncbi:3-hydroxyisobutyrate dehydrogenase (Fragment) [Geodia barretti]|uniref:3-hydroxyisobutyrate dehydrogenase n=1 Tax=Geodia barretti TaxID=519541 RepID=A0AA35TX77_GEOBA
MASSAKVFSLSRAAWKLARCYSQPATGPVGFIGLGNMGLPMAQNLVTRGHQLVLYDISPGRVEEVGGGGGCGESGRGGSTSPHRHHDAALGEEPDGLLCRGRRYTQCSPARLSPDRLQYNSTGRSERSGQTEQRKLSRVYRRSGVWRSGSSKKEFCRSLWVGPARITPRPHPSWNAWGKTSFTVVTMATGRPLKYVITCCWPLE